MCEGKGWCVTNPKIWHCLSTCELPMIHLSSHANNARGIHACFVKVDNTDICVALSPLLSLTSVTLADSKTCSVNSCADTSFSSLLPKGSAGAPTKPLTLTGKSNSCSAPQATWRGVSPRWFTWLSSDAEVAWGSTIADGHNTCQR